MKYLIIIFTFLLSSCTEQKSPNQKFEPTHTEDSIYLKSDSTVAYVNFYGVLVGKDTTYFYGVYYLNGNDTIKKVVTDEDIYNTN